MVTIGKECTNVGVQGYLQTDELRFWSVKNLPNAEEFRVTKDGWVLIGPWKDRRQHGKFKQISP
jgi:hypothetical protein